MTQPKQGRPHHVSGAFARSRAEAVHAESIQRVRATRTVASHALDRKDRRALMSMLDLPEQDAGPADHTMALALDEYVRAVAEEVGVPPEGTSCEVTDTATAYLALARRGSKHPDRDLMLIWNERQGWIISVETDPTEPTIVLARLGGDPVPQPAAVASFVTETIQHGQTATR